MGRFDTVYADLPVWAQNAAVTCYGAYWYWLRRGPGLHRFVAEFRQRDAFTTQQWLQWQEQHLRKLLPATARHVPFYREAWSKSERESAMAGRLHDLPLLEKESLRSNEAAFLRQDLAPRFRFTHHTSGSTGTPIASTRTAREIRRGIALREVRSAGWAGVSFKLPRATFSGRIVEPDPNSDGPFYRFNRVERQAYLSAFHLKPASVELYVEALRRCRVRWMTGYAVSFYLLAQLMLEHQIEPPCGLQAVVTTSEKLTAPMRQTMEAAYNCPVFEEYSSVENISFASECEHGRLHVSPDMGIVEILRPDGTACNPGEPGEVVATGLIRQYQPLVRYRLGDVATWDKEPCSCGRSLPVLKEVLGRLEDVVIGPDGRQMVRFHGIFVAQPRIREGQIIQEALDRMRIKVVATSGFAQADEEDIKSRIRQRLGPEVDVIVEQVPEIPRSSNGKFRPVISLLREQRCPSVERTGIA